MSKRNSKTFSLLDWEKEYEAIYPEEGVYTVFAKNKRYISRLKDNDRNSILYIGSSKNIRRRLSYLFDSLKKKNRNKLHTFGKTYYLFKINNIIPVNNISVEIFYCNNSVDLEDKLIKGYIRNYGESPPLNSKLVKN